MKYECAVYKKAATVPKFKWTKSCLAHPTHVTTVMKLLHLKQIDEQVLKHQQYHILKWVCV